MSVLVFLLPSDKPHADSVPWCLGNYDPFRNLLFKKNGFFRKWTKHAIVLWFIFVLSMVWLFAED
jgi:hypothetical protein